MNKNTKSATTILVVEDDELLNKSIRRLLDGAGMKSEGFFTGATALERVSALSNTDNVLLLLDYSLPDMTAREFVEKVRGRGLEIPFMIITGHGDEMIAVEMMKLGAVEYVAKSIQFHEILPVKVKHACEEIENRKKLAEAEIQRKLTTEALSISEARYRRLFESAKDGILILDSETGMVVDVNPFLIKLLGYSHEQFMGKTIWDLGLFKDIIANKENFLELQRKEYIRYVDLPLETADGRRIDVEFVSNVYVVGRKKVIQCNIRDITEWLSQRKLAEKALRQSEARYRILFEQAADIILQLEIAPKGMPVIRDANNAALRLLGYARDELIGQPVSFINVAFDGSQTINEMRQNILSRLGKVFETKHRCKDGTVRDFECSATEMQVGSKTFAVSLERDITERKKSEEELQNTNKLLESVFSSSEDLIAVVDRNLRILKSNWKSPLYAGCTEFPIGSHCFEAFIHRDSPCEPCEPFGVFNSGKPVVVEYYNEYTKLFKEVSAYPIFDNNNNVTMVVENVHDITERKQSEKALQESEERYRTLFDDAKDGIALADSETGKIVECNQALCRMVGMDKTELVGQMQSVIHPAQNLLNGQSAAFVKHKTDDPGITVDDQIISKSGALTPVEIRAARVQMNGRDYMLGIFRDVSERKQHEKERENLQIQLLQAQKMEAMGTLAGGVAHDFNNLLCAISGYTTLAIGKIDESDPVQRDLRQVSVAADKAAGVVRQLLLFSRKQHMEPMPMDVNAAITRLLKMLDRLIGEDIVIETGLEKGVWTILGDEGNIEQMLMNLAVNARDAMPEGGKIFMKTENVTIDEEYCRTSKTARPGRFVRISVSDTGTGMDELTQQHIFEPFFTTKPAGKGTGLGLSVVFGIVQQHKGWIDVYSEPGHGTTFSAYFPASSASPEQQSKEKAGAASLEGKGERVMIVEDQAEVRAIAKELLLTNGYSVFAVSNAKEAMELFERENGKFDLVFSDVVLPDRSGILMVQDLLKRGKFKVLITSGYTDEKAHWDFIKENNFRFLHKPYAVRDLLQAVRGVLDGGGGGVEEVDS